MTIRRERCRLDGDLRLFSLKTPSLSEAPRAAAGASSHLLRNPPKQIHLRQPPPLKLWRSRGYGGYPFRIHPRRSGRGFLRRRINLGNAPTCVPSGLYQPGTPSPTGILRPSTCCAEFALDTQGQNPLYSVPVKLSSYHLTSPSPHLTQRAILP
jgi:hypothetical protein